MARRSMCICVYMCVYVISQNFLSLGMYIVVMMMMMIMLSYKSVDENIEIEDAVNQLPLYE